MGSDSFVQLHCHDTFSFLDGAAKIEDTVRIAEQHGSPGIATTNHGNVYSLANP